MRDLPCISDPGADIVAKGSQEGFAVVPIPGANAALKCTNSIRIIDTAIFLLWFFKSK